MDTCYLANNKLEETYRYCNGGMNWIEDDKGCVEADCSFMKGGPPVVKYYKVNSGSYVVINDERDIFECIDNSCIDKWFGVC